MAPRLVVALLVLAAVTACSTAEAPPWDDVPDGFPGDDAVGDHSGDDAPPPDDAPGEADVPPGTCTRDADCDDGLDCTADSCDLGRSICVHTPETAVCDDGNPCNGSERCDVVLGCLEGTPVDCNDGIGCTTDRCDPLTGACASSPDHDACPGDQLCDPAEGGCVDPPACGTDIDCADGDLCNGVETCTAAFRCAPGVPVDCDDGVACTVDRCDPAAGSCSHPADDGACQDGNPCNGAEVCDAVAGCRPGTPPDCDDGFACTRDGCDPLTGRCTHVPDDAPCSNGRFCDGQEVCDLAVGCRPGTPPRCDDAVDCTLDTCDVGLDRCTSLPDDSRCDNGQLCDGAERCTAGVGCGAGVPPACDDGRACTSDRCDPAGAGGRGACVNLPADLDGDTAGDAACGGTDCNDRAPLVYPGAPEVCNAGDDDCDASTDETFACVRDSVGSCSTGCGSTGTRICSSSCAWGACAPPAESCNGRDDDCNGVCDNGFVCCAGTGRPCATSCGSTGTETCSAACGWGACAPPAESCNGRDDDCDTLCDDGFACCQGAVASCTVSGCTGTAACGTGCVAGTCNLGSVPANDTCSGSTTTLSSSTTVSFSTCAARNDYTASCGSSAASADVVFRLTLATRSNVVLETLSSNFDPVLHLHANGSCMGAELACSDDYSGAEARISGIYDPGTYWVVVDGYGTASQGTGQLRATITSAGPTCTVIEGFESGAWPASGWTVVAAGGTVSSAYAHDGSYGLRNPGWHYRTATTFGAAGESFFAWIRPSAATSGRTYLGFAASSGGCKSIVLAANTSQIMFQDNASWGYTELNTAAYSYTGGRWYKLEVTFAAGNSVTARLYDSDGVTLRASASQTFSSSVSGGAALRIFDNQDVDTLTVCRP